MNIASNVRTHRDWEDWSAIAVGLFVVLSPWISGQAADAYIVFATIAIGAAIVLLAQSDLMRWMRPFEYGQLIAGLALIALPFVLGYAGSGSLRYMHIVAGGLVALLALLEVWQDWKLSDEELARHGR